MDLFGKMRKVAGRREHNAQLRHCISMCPEKDCACSFFGASLVFRQSAEKVLFRTFLGPFLAFFRTPIYETPITVGLKYNDRGPGFL